MPETCENWLGVVNRCIYYAHPLNLPGTVLLNGFQSSPDLWTSEMTIKLKSDLYIDPVNISPNFLYWMLWTGWGLNKMVAIFNEFSWINILRVHLTVSHPGTKLLPKPTISSRYLNW